MVVVPEIPHGIWDDGTCWAPWLQDDAVIGKATMKIIFRGNHVFPTSLSICQQVI
jgi:hypothetical protein